MKEEENYDPMVRKGLFDMPLFKIQSRTHSKNVKVSKRKKKEEAKKKKQTHTPHPKKEAKNKIEIITERLTNILKTSNDS